MYEDTHLEEAPITALLVEDDPDEVYLLTEAIRDAGAKHIKIIHTDAMAGALKILREGPVDAVLLDLSLPDSSGIEGVVSVVEVVGEAPVIVCTGLNDQSIAQDAIRAGAQDYLVKNPKLYGAVPRILRHTVERCRLIAASNKRVLQARQYTELLLTKVIAVADSGLGITDERGAFHVVNPALAELRGSTIGNLVGRPWTDILPQADRAAEHEAYLRSLSGEGDYDHQNLTIEREDGSTIEVSMRSVQVCLGENRPCRVLSFRKPERVKPVTQRGLSEAQFADNLKQRVGGKPAELAAGRVMVLGLQSLREELGERWDLVAGSIREISERTIAQHLSPKDSFTATPTCDYLICFGEADEKQAAATVDAIVRQIRLEILTSEEDHDSTVPTLEPELRSQLADVGSETGNIQVTPDEVSNPGEITTVIAGKINESVERAKATTNGMIADLHRQCRGRALEVHTRDRGTASLAMHDIDPDSRLLCDRLFNLSKGDPDVLAEVDNILLGNAAQKIYDLGTVKASLMAVDVHYSTLLDRSLSKKFTSLCQTLDGIAARSLVFNVKGIPTAAKTAEVGATLSQLKPFSRFRMMTIKKPSIGRLDLKKANITLLRIAYVDIINSFYRDPVRSKYLVKLAHDQGARVVVDRITAVDASHLFKDFSIDFVCFEPSTARVA